MPFARTAALAVLLFCGPAAAEEPEFAVEFVRESAAAMENPHDIALSPDGRHLFVADVGNNRVLVLDADTLRQADAWGSDHQKGTHDVAFDSDGRLYVADTQNHRATLYRMEGTRGQLIGEFSRHLRGVEGVLPHPNGRVYVGGAWSGNVVVFDGPEVVGELRGLSSPHDLALAPNGSIWLADSGNDRLLRLSTDLKILQELKGPPYDFVGPRYLDVMPDGTLIVADKNSHSVKVIRKDGRLVATLGGQKGQGPRSFTTPEGVAVAGTRLYIADSGNDRILRYRILRH